MSCGTPSLRGAERRLVPRNFSGDGRNLAAKERPRYCETGQVVAQLWTKPVHGLWKKNRIPQISMLTRTQCCKWLKKLKRLEKSTL